MTDTPESSTDSTACDADGGARTPTRLQRAPPARLYQVLAWVGIVAGVVFIVAVIFFSGVFFGRASGGHHGWHRGYQGGQMGPNESRDDCPMMRPAGMMGPRWNDGTGSALSDHDAPVSAASVARARQCQATLTYHPLATLSPS